MNRQILAETVLPELEQDDMTRKVLMDMNGWSEGQAIYRANQMVAKGLWSEIAKRAPNGSKVIVYVSNTCH
jgi:hypothetical protein